MAMKKEPRNPEPASISLNRLAIGFLTGASIFGVVALLIFGIPEILSLASDHTYTYKCPAPQSRVVERNYNYVLLAVGLLILSTALMVGQLSPKRSLIYRIISVVIITISCFVVIFYLGFENSVSQHGLLADPCWSI